MVHAARWFLMLALLLAPVLHATAMSAPDPAAGCAQSHSPQNHSSGGDENAVGGVAPAHGSGFHGSCAGSGACDLQMASLGGAPSCRAASVFERAHLDELTGRGPPPDPLPPRLSF